MPVTLEQPPKAETKLMPEVMEKLEKLTDLIPGKILGKGLSKVLLKDFRLAAGQEKRLLPHLDVSRWDRLHFHFSNGNRAVDGLQARILFGTPMPGSPCGALLADSTVWFEETVTEREFIHTTPTNYNRTGFVMSVPVVAPELYDVILRNVGTADLESLYVTVMAQEI
jgi:hypothetical protein